MAGARQLLDHVKNFYLANFGKDLTEPKLNAKVSGLLSRHRGGVIKPERTKKTCIKKSVGAPGAYSKVEKDKVNKKWSPITTRLPTRSARTKMTPRIARLSRTKALVRTCAPRKRRMAYVSTFSTKRRMTSLTT